MDLNFDGTVIAIYSGVGNNETYPGEVKIYQLSNLLKSNDGQDDLTSKSFMEERLFRCSSYTIVSLLKL